MQKWEYHTIEAITGLEVNKELASLGNDGWELVAVTPTRERRVDFKNGGYSYMAHTQYIFKRPIDA